MRYIYFFLLIAVFSLNACENNTNENTEKATTFNFKVKGDISGYVTTEFGEASIQCDGNRTIISFKEIIPPNIEEETDLLFGELIFAFLYTDSIGTFPLNGISGTRVNGQVGFVALLNLLDFDDLSAQYISNVKRLQEIKTGNLTISKWSKVIGERVEGSVEVTLINEREEVTIRGDFSILVKEKYGFCL